MTDIIDNSFAGATCKNCGAPITSEICPYCGSMTGLNTEKANMDYPVLECKEATLNFWTIAFPLIFAFGFGFFGTIFPIMMVMSGDTDGDGHLVFLFCIPFGLIGLIAGFIVVRTLVRYIRLKVNGKHITGTVCGYVNDNVRMNGSPAQVVKILIDTPAGKRVIMYQLNMTTKPYGVNTEIGLIVYRDMFMIEKRKETINW